MATNGVDPGGYYPPMVTGGASGVGTDPYAPTPSIPTPPTANPSPSSAMNGYTAGSGLMSPLTGPGMPTLSFFAEDGGGIPDTGAQGIPDNGVQDNQGVPDNQGFDPDKLGTRSDQIQNVQNTLGYLRQQAMGANSGQDGQAPALDLTHLVNTGSQFNQQGFDDGGPVIPENDDDVTGAVAAPAQQGDADQALASQQVAAQQQGAPGVTQFFNSDSNSPFWMPGGGVDMDAVIANGVQHLKDFPANAARVARWSVNPQSNTDTGNAIAGLVHNVTTLPGSQEFTENKKALWDYLSGSGAWDPNAVVSLEKKVDPNDEMDPNDRKLATVTAAQQVGGQQAATGVLQSYRQQYDHYRAFASAAATGGNMDSAIDAANEAFTRLPDGHKIVFENTGDDKITAHLQGADGNKAGQVPLTRDQFTTLMRGNGSLFDNMMDAGSTNMIRHLFTGQNTNDQNDQTGATPGQQQGAPQQPGQFASVGVQRGMNRQVQAVPREGAPGQTGAAPPANTQGSVRSQLAKLMGVSEDEITQVMPSPRDQFAALMAQKKQQTADEIARTKANNPLGLAQMRAQNALDVQDKRGQNQLAVQRAKGDTWAQTYDLRDRNEQRKLLLQAQLRQQTDAGRNAVSVARGMIGQGRTMADVDQYFKQQGVDFGKLTGLANIAPVSTNIQQPGQQQGAPQQPGNQQGAPQQPGNQQGQPQTVYVGGRQFVLQPNGKYLPVQQ